MADGLGRGNSIAREERIPAPTDGEYLPSIQANEGKERDLEKKLADEHVAQASTSSQRSPMYVQREFRQEVRFSGPLPPPELLARYNDAAPNGADRILAMAEKQSAHREEMEKVVIEGNVRSQERGSWFAFIVVMTAMLVGALLIFENKSISGLATIITAVGSAAGIFIYSKKSQQKERIEKTAPERQTPLPEKPPAQKRSAANRRKK